LCEEGRLAEAGSGLDHRDRVLPASFETIEQAGPAHFVGQGHRKSAESGAGKMPHQSHRASRCDPPSLDVSLIAASAIGAHPTTTSAERERMSIAMRFMLIQTYAR
jgi:hypothetical protein